MAIGKDTGADAPAADAGPVFWSLVNIAHLHFRVSRPAGERWQAAVYPRPLAIAQRSMPRTTLLWLRETDAIGIEPDAPVRVRPICSLFECECLPPD